MPYYVGHDDYFSNLWPIYLCLALSRLFFKSITYLIASCLTTTNFQIYDRFICVLPYHDYFSYLWPIYLRLASPLLFFKSITYLFVSCLTTIIFLIYDLFICVLPYHDYFSNPWPIHLHLVLRVAMRAESCVKIFFLWQIKSYQNIFQEGKCTWIFDSM